MGKQLRLQDGFFVVMMVLVGRCSCWCWCWVLLLVHTTVDDKRKRSDMAIPDVAFVALYY